MVRLLPLSTGRPAVCFQRMPKRMNRLAFESNDGQNFVKASFLALSSFATFASLGWAAAPWAALRHRQDISQGAFLRIETRPHSEYKSRTSAGERILPGQQSRTRKHELSVTG